VGLRARSAITKLSAIFDLECWLREEILAERRGH
jgi:hypothetical protein